MKYTDKQLDYLMELKAAGMSYKDIAESFNKKYKGDFTYQMMRKAFRHHEEKYDLTEAVSTDDIKRTDTKTKYMTAYADYVMSNNKRPSLFALKSVGIDASQINAVFGGILGLEQASREEFPLAFDHLVDESLFTKKYFKEIKQEIQNKDTFFITAAVTGKEIHDDAYQSIKTWEKATGGMLLVQPCSDPASRDDGAKWTLPSVLNNDYIVAQDLALNKKLTLSSIRLTAKQIIPLSGLDRLTKRLGSIILAAPKQHLKHIPDFNSNGNTFALMTTGAITLPDYNTAQYLSERTGYLAEHDHCLGGIIVELEKDGSFHFRQVQFEPKTGAFIDIDKKYHADGKVTNNNISLIRCGDYHVGHTDPVVKKALGKIAKKYKPDYLVVEDFNNGTSISPFDRRRKISRAKKVAERKTNLEGEFELLADEANFLAKLPVKEIIFIRDNHSLFLERYLENCEFRDDPENLIIALDLAKAMALDKNPTQFGIEDLMDTANSKFRFLKKDESFAPNGIENSIHGHLYRGKRNPTPANLDIVYGAISVGHDHTAMIFRNVFRCGTMSYLSSEHVEYLDGASNWTQTMIFEHENGSRQLINIVKGKHRRG